MAKYVGRNTAQKEFVKKFGMLTAGSHARWQVWQDMIWLFATVISNAVDKRFSDEREKTYLRIIGQYKPEEQAIFPELFAMLVESMEAEGFCDFLGELFMLLELNFSGTGQFFTPYDVCKMMAMIDLDVERAKADIDRYGYMAVCDPACGAGATLIAAADVLQSNGINYQQTALFAAQDIDSTVALMCYVQLSLLGCAGYVVIGNTLTEPMVGHTLYGEPGKERCWYTPMYFTERWDALRTADRWRRAFAAVATLFPSTLPDGKAANIAADTAPQRAAQTAVEEAPADEPHMFTVTSDKRQIEGQLTMF